MPLSPQAVAERNKRSEQQMNTIGVFLATTLGIALTCGVGKLIVDMKKVQLNHGRRKQPWERL
jgi:hypothetical protein